WLLRMARLLALSLPLVLALVAREPGLRTAWAAGEAPAPAVQESTTDSAFILPFANPAQQRRQHLAGLGVDRWHAAGYRGRGIKVAILDTGFRGYREHLGQAVPEHVTVRSFRADGNLEAKDSQHGILCGEVVHALAPEAELLLANWEPDRSDQFLDAVRWAREEGARILSCSLIMPSWSDGEGGGHVHAELARLLGKGGQAGDVLCFASAGNTAQRHWGGPFHDGGDGFHEWASSQNNLGVRTGLPANKDNGLTPWGEEKVSVELCWHTKADYDLSVHDRTTSADVAQSLAERGVERGCAVARFNPQPQPSSVFRLRLARGPAGPFHLFALGAGLQYTNASGSIPFPADSPLVVAVGAVTLEGQRLSYSSCGPNSPQPKPDL